MMYKIFRRMIRPAIVVLAMIVFHANLMAQDATRNDIPLKLYNCSLYYSGSLIEKGELIELQFIVENYRKQQSPNTEFGIIVPSGVNVIYGVGSHTIEPMAYKETRGIMYKISIDQSYNNTVVPIKISMANDEGVVVPCYMVEIVIGQPMRYAKIGPVSQSTSMANNTADKSTNTPKPPITKNKLYTVVVNSHLNVREMPSTQSKVVGVLVDGAQVEVYNIKNGWAEIGFQQKPAYIVAKYLKETACHEESPMDAPVVVGQKTICAYQEPVQNSHPQKQRRHCLIASVSLGLSNLTSPGIISPGNVSWSAKIGMRSYFAFLPKTMFMEALVGFDFLGDNHYSFQKYSVGIFPVGFSYNMFYTQAGLALLLGGDGMYVSNGEFHKRYPEQSNICLVVKQGIARGVHWDLGVLYLHGLNNVCSGLPIGVHHNAFQIYATYMFKRK